MATTVKTMDELSKDDRYQVLQALDVRIAQVKRAVSAAKNPAIAELLEKEQNDLVALQARFR